MNDQANVPQATDEEVAEIKQILSFGGLDLGISNKAVAKLLARLEAVERERAQIERDLKFCEEELAAGEW